MIQLASDPNASRSTWRPAPPEDKEATLQGARARHAWPFISSYTDKPVAEEQPKKPANEHGS